MGLSHFKCQYSEEMPKKKSTKSEWCKVKETAGISEQLELCGDRREYTMDQAVETGKGFAMDKIMHRKTRSFLAQVIASCSKYLMLLDIGMAVSYATIAIPPLLKGDGSIKITEAESSWFASLVFIWQPVGSMTTVAFSKYGRKKVMIFLQLPLLIGWIIPYYATTVWELYAAASILGLGVGFVQAPIATYIGEITQPQYRGGLASVAYSMFTLGQAIMFGIDVITENWRLSAIVSTIMPILTAIHLIMLPESPLWLISKGRFEEARNSLKWLRGWVSDEAVEQEFKDMLFHNCDRYAELCAEEGGVSSSTDYRLSFKEFTSKHSIQPSMATETEKMPWTKKYFLRPEMYNPTIFTIIFMYLSNGSGLGAFRSYLINLIPAFGIHTNEVKLSVEVTIVGLVGTIFMVVLIPIIGKRKLTFISVVLTSLGCFALGFYIWFGSDLNMPWIPIVILVEILFASNMGISHIPWIQISEIFPLKGKTFGTGLVAGLGNVLQFIGTKLFYTYKDILTLGGVFIMYGVTYVIGLVYLYFYQVETEGRPLNDIVEDFKSRRRTRR